MADGEKVSLSTRKRQKTVEKASKREVTEEFDTF